MSRLEEIKARAVSGASAVRPNWMLGTTVALDRLEWRS